MLVRKRIIFFSSAYLALSNVGVIYNVVSCDNPYYVYCSVIVIIILCLCIILHIKLVYMIIIVLVILLLDTICKLNNIVAALEKFMSVQL